MDKKFIIFLVVLSTVVSVFLAFAYQKGILEGQKFAFTFSRGGASISTLNIKIGSWDLERGGFFALAQGDGMAKARQTIANSFPSATHVELLTLSSLNLNPLDIVFIGVVKNIDYANNKGYSVDPMISSEQTALKNFVLGGGCAVLMTDNDSYTDNTDDSDIIVNRSFTNPFGISTAGTDPGPEYNIVSTSVSHPLLNGIRYFVQNYPGWFTSMPSYATVLARNGYVPGSPFRNAPSVVVFNRNVLGPGSGPVIFFSDTNSFIDNEDGGEYQVGLEDGDNAQMLKNIISYCGKRLISSPTPSLSVTPTPTQTITFSPTPTLAPTTTFCPQDVRRCPDGSYVGRTGPNCEFICPPTSTTPSPTPFWWWLFR